MTKKCSLRLLGPFFLQNAAGQDITPNTQKWCALLAMLATAPNGRRSRKWLQDRLWSESNEQNGSVSLRQALFQIRRKLGVHEALLSSDKSVVHLELSQLDIDVLNVDHLAVNGAEVPQFLEGIDVEDFEFEDWLREQREYWFNNLNARYSNRQFQHNEPNGVAESAQSSSGLASDPLVLSPVVDAVIGRASNNQQKPKNFAVAVLPLVNLTEDPQLDFIADGFAEELIDGLSRLCWLPVISRYSTFAFRSRTPDLFAISDRLGSRYLVNGDLTKSGNELKVRVELNHMEDGSSVWASTFSLPGSLHSAVVNQALSEIVGKLDSSIDQYEQRMSVNPGYVASGYNENIWRGRWYLNKLTREDSIEARKYFDRALADNPEEPEALMQSAIWYLLQLWVNRGSVEDIQKVMPHLRKAQPIRQFTRSKYRFYADAGLPEQKTLRDRELAFLEANKDHPSFDFSVYLSTPTMLSRLVGSMLRLFSWLARKTGRINFVFLPYKILARSADVKAAFEDNVNFKVPFGPEMKAIAGPVTFGLGLDDNEHKMQRAIMALYMEHDREVAGADSWHDLGVSAGYILDDCGGGCGQSQYSPVYRTLDAESHAAIEGYAAGVFVTPPDAGHVSGCGR